jgi:zinc transport system substrate-binding protein
MKKVFLILLVLVFMLSACATKPQNETTDLNEDQGLKVIVSIPPLQWLVEQIGGDLVQVQSLTVSGDDPHSYEPSPAQMTAVSQADLYLAINIEFEEVWIPRFQSNNKDLLVEDISEGIERINMPESLTEDEEHDHEEHDEHEHNEHDEHEHHHDGLDPHVWLSPSGMKQLAIKAAEDLKLADPDNAATYASNLEACLQKIGSVEEQLNAMLANPARQQFLIIHPSLGYLANEYKLIMLPVEVDGQEPTPAQMAALLSASQEYGIHTLFIQQGSNIATANALADQAGIETIVEFDPLAYDWEANLLKIGQSLQKALN